MNGKCVNERMYDMQDALYEFKMAYGAKWWPSDWLTNIPCQKKKSSVLFRTTCN